MKSSIYCVVGQIIINSDRFTTDPLDILEGRLDIETGSNSLWYLLDVPGLYELFFMISMMTGAICLLLSMIHFLMVRKRDLKAEIKADIMHRILLLFLLGMGITIMDALLLVGKMLNGA